MAYKYGMIPSVPDSRDRIFQNPSHVPLPASFDLSHWMKPVKNQGNLGSCTGNAYAGIAELQFKKYRNLDVTLSPLFIYAMERTLEEVSLASDVGAQPRSGCIVLQKFGVCLENEDPYKTKNFSIPPNAAQLSEALSYKMGTYLRLYDLPSMKRCLAALPGQAELPIALGMSVYESFESQAMASNGELPMPEPGEQRQGGHMIYAFGYDDKHRNLDGSRGAFHIRNSWGRDWGQSGNFWMPYAYIVNPSYVSDLWVTHFGNWGPTQ